MRRKLCHWGSVLPIEPRSCRRERLKGGTPKLRALIGGECVVDAGGPGVAEVRHILDGYRLLEERGFHECARICLTHSFPIKQVDAFPSNWDCPREEREFVQHYLDSTEFTAYDRLVQLCDALALPSGPCRIEKRPVDVALRHGFNALTLSKWHAIFSLGQEFRTALGASIYTVLPGVVENTFGSDDGRGGHLPLRQMPPFRLLGP